jgi:hypothetical protein
MHCLPGDVSQLGPPHLGAIAVLLRANVRGLHLIDRGRETAAVRRMP